MRTVFLGTPALAVPTLAAVAAQHDVAAVVCQPDKPQGRSGAPVQPPTKEWALAHGIPVHQPTKLNDGTFEQWLRDLCPEVGIVFAYGRLLKQPILDVPPHGWLNVHPSLLPRWRGPSPIQSAILNGDTETGISIMRLVLEMDAGPLLLQERLAIGPDETAEELTERIAPRCAELLCDALAQVAAGTATITPQAAEGLTHCGMLRKEDGYLRWDRPAQALHNQVRGSLPWPAAQCQFRGGICKILRSRLVHGNTAEAPGTITAIEKDAVIVATGDGLLGITEFQAPGKKPLPMGDFARGARLQPGERFEDLA
jgi:methionyl-tRNA formyltransferase